MISEVVSFKFGEGHQIPLCQIAIEIAFFQAKWLKLS
jgi:hypothetical protein